MKKILIVSLLLLGFVSFAQKGPRNVGVKLSTGLEVSYQHVLGVNQFVEANLGYKFGIFSNSEFFVNASWNKLLSTNKLNNADYFNWYVGAGAELGLASIWAKGESLVDYITVKQVPYLGVGGHTGIEYMFTNIPLTLSLDLGLLLKPTNFIVKAQMPLADVFEFRSSLGIRYNF